MSVQGIGNQERQAITEQDYADQTAERQRQWVGRFLLVLALGGLVPWSDDAVLAHSTLSGHNRLQKGAIEIGVATGYAQATTAIGDSPSANRSAVLVLPRIGIVLTDVLGSGWYQGNLELLLEPVYARFTRPFSAEAAGGSLVLKYNFLSFGRWLPFWDAGAGMIWTNLAPRIPEQSTQFEFVLETGPGVQYALTTNLMWTMGVRFHHISNGGLGERNTGINAVLPYAGLSWFLPGVF